MTNQGSTLRETLFNGRMWCRMAGVVKNASRLNTKEAAENKK
jgi:hypothetical protein